MHLLTTRHHGGHQRNSNRTAEISDEAGKTGCVPHLFPADRRDRKRGHWHENGGDSKSAEDNRPDDVVGSDLERYVSDQIHREGKPDGALPHPDTAIDFVDDPSRNDAANDGSDPARAQHQAGLRGGVAHQILKELGQNRGCPIQDRTYCQVH